MVTQPDKPAGRGQRLTRLPVKQRARGGRACPCCSPPGSAIRAGPSGSPSSDADVAVVVAFGQILPKAVLDVPARGSINVHASLLPRYRGAAPIAWAIIRGETETGITTFQMDPGMDTGDMLLREATPIGPEETAGELAARLAPLGAAVLLRTLARLDALAPEPQDHAQATLAPRLKKEDGWLRLGEPARSARRSRPRLQPMAGRRAHHAGRRASWSGARARCRIRRRRPPGTLVTTGPGATRLATGEGLLLPVEVQPENRKAMAWEDFLRGARLRAGRPPERDRGVSPSARGPRRPGALRGPAHPRARRGRPGLRRHRARARARPRALEPRDAALCTEIVYGTLRWQRHLDWRLAAHLHRPLARLDPWVRALLRLTAYQVLFLDRVPRWAAVDEAVSLAKLKSRTPGPAEFVNAVLRALTRAPAAPALPRPSRRGGGGPLVVSRLDRRALDRALRPRRGGGPDGGGQRAAAHRAAGEPPPHRPRGARRAPARRGAGRDAPHRARSRGPRAGKGRGGPARPLRGRLVHGTGRGVHADRPAPRPAARARRWPMPAPRRAPRPPTSPS